MSETLVPSADTNNPGSYEDYLGGSSNIYQYIADGLETWIVSPVAPSTAIYVTKLSSPSGTPGTGQWALFFYGKKLPNQGAQQLDVTVELREGYVDEGTPGTLIVTIDEEDYGFDGQFRGSSVILSAGEIASITDPTDLYVRIVANAP